MFEISEGKMPNFNEYLSSVSLMLAQSLLKALTNPPNFSGYLASVRSSILGLHILYLFNTYVKLAKTRKGPAC